MTDVRERIAPIFPDGYPRARRLLPLYHSAVTSVKQGADYRRKISRDPVLFALLYLPEYFTDATTGQISFSEMHLAAYDRMVRWWEPGPDRSAWASHREAGKSVLWFLDAPLWAAAHGLHDYWLMLSDTGGQVKKHLGILRGVLEEGGLLVHDFPHLRRGRPWTVTDIRTAGGCRFTAAGMGENVLGARDRARRPSIVGDDLEPGPEDWTPASKAKTLGRLTNDVLRAAAPTAAIVLTGTPVATGSLMHDVVRAVRGRSGALEDRGEWVRAKGFDPYWFPAIVEVGTERERSVWETRHPIARLRAERAADPREFALQMMCDPDDPAASRWWTDDERTSVFRYDPHFGAVWHILSIDGATTRDVKKSDKSAVSVIGVGPGVGEDRELCVERSIAGHWSHTELKGHAWDLTREFRRTLRTWIVDATGVGDHAVAALGAPPAGVTVVPFTTTQDSKRYRIETLFGDYARGAVWHRGKMVSLEAQMCAWKPTLTGPGVDDQIDTVRAAKDYALYGDASRAPARGTW